MTTRCSQSSAASLSPCSAVDRGLAGVRVRRRSLYLSGARGRPEERRVGTVDVADVSRRIGAYSTCRPAMCRTRGGV
jgi:hypothetical protein